MGLRVGNRMIHAMLLIVLLSTMMARTQVGAVQAPATDTLSPPPAVPTSPGFSEEEAEWPTLAANPQRTSWTPEEVEGPLHPVWYRPIEPFINYKVQVIAANGLLYIATAGGLYALTADRGDVAWVYPTDMPLGHSPTVAGGVVYVGGYDGMMHALDATPQIASLPLRDGVRVNDRVLWTFTAGAGFETNPLVVDGRLYAGNRDGYLYALDADTGALLWRHRTGAAITFSAAYAGGAVYFASNDGFAYAVTVDGVLLWRSGPLPGAGFHSYWPVVYDDYVVFAGSTSYGFAAGLSVGQLNNQLDNVGAYLTGATDPRGTPLGPVGTEPGDWVAGTTTIDASSAAEYLEERPWRRTYFVLSRSSGRELTFDSDGDGLPEYAPILWTGTHSGNRYPPIVASDSVLYQQQSYLSDRYIPGGQVSGWKLGTPFISQISRDWQAVDEPQAYSAGGSLIYWTNCCDREAGVIDISTPVDSPDRERSYYSYDLDERAPGYWTEYSGPYETRGWGLKGTHGGPNGVYGTHGTQNPLVPYDGRLYKIAGNTVLALGARVGDGLLPAAEYVPVEDAAMVLSEEAVRKRLETEVAAMVSAGHLRPGYHNAGHADQVLGHNSNSYLTHYFHNPAETFHTLLRALPFLSADLQAETRRYLQREYADHGDLVHIGWQEGAPREAYAVPPEVEEKMRAFSPQTDIYGSSWDDRYRVYGLWKYAEEFGGARGIFDGVRGKMPIVNPGLDSLQSRDMDARHLRVRLPLVAMSASLHAREETIDTPSAPSDSAGAPGTYAYHPYMLNAYIAGYFGYLGLERLAGEPESPEIRAELDRLLALLVSTFSKDSPYSAYDTYHNALNLARNFMYMVPELADYLHDHAYARVREALDEYQRVAPYWFVSGYDATYGEGAIQHLFDPVALFQAKARILKEPYEELAKYLDVPAFAVGDLYYIQNLVSLLEAKPQENAPSVPTGAFGGRQMAARAILSADQASRTTMRIGPVSVLSPGPIGAYSRFEIAFAVNTAASNPYFPYDPAAPAGVESGTGITVDILALPPGESDWSIAVIVPAFHYQPVEQVGSSKDAALLPTGPPEWRARFSPPAVGTWQYRIRATDASGTAESPIDTVRVVASDHSGFVGVSSTDSRFFAFRDGTPFITPLVNLEQGSPFNSLSALRANIRVLGENGIRFVRWFPTGEGANYAVAPFGDDMRIAWRFGDGWSTIHGVDTAAGKEVSFSPYYYSAQSLPAVPGARYRLTFRAKVTGERVLRAGLGSLGSIDICSAAGTRHASSGSGDTCDYAREGWNDYELVLTNPMASVQEVYLRGLYVSADAPAPYDAEQPGQILLNTVRLQRDETGQGDWGPNLLTRSDPETHLRVDQRSAALLDEILSLSERYGVYHKLTLFHKNDVVLNWLQPDGSIATDTGVYNSHFYSDEGQAARWYEDAYVRYFVARWSYSPALHSVELANENHLRTDSYEAGLDLAEYLNRLSPRQLLVTNSFWGYWVDPFFKDPARGSLVDYSDKHWYASGSSTDGEVISTIWDDSAAYVRECSLRFDEYRSLYSYKGPIVRGEGGTAESGTSPQYASIAQDPRGAYYHKKLWAHVGVLGDTCDGEWYPRIFMPSREDQFPSSANSLPRMFAAYERFMSGEPLADGGVSGVGTDLTGNAAVLLQVSTGTLRAWGSRNGAADRVLLWIDNAKDTWKHVADAVPIEPASGALTVQGLSPGEYRVEWWDTTAGAIVSTDTRRVLADGHLTVTVTDLATDIAAKLVRVRDSTPPWPTGALWSVLLPFVTW